MRAEKRACSTPIARRVSGAAGEGDARPVAHSRLSPGCLNFPDTTWELTSTKPGTWAPHLRSLGLRKSVWNVARVDAGPAEIPEEYQPVSRETCRSGSDPPSP